MTVEEHERLAHEALDALRREYELRAEPYLQMLCKIHAMRVPAMVISIDELQRLQVKLVETGK